MRREDLTELFGRLPAVEHPKVQLIVRNGPMLSVDTVVRFEPTYVVFRGREGGQTDDERGFFVPYDEIVFLKWERAVKLSELTGLYGTEQPTVPQAQPSDPAAIVTTPALMANPPLTATPSPAPAATPAEIARQNLLARIKAAKSIAGG
jgi:hypothetical protein